MGTSSGLGLLLVAGIAGLALSLAGKKSVAQPQAPESGDTITGVPSWPKSSQPAYEEPIRVLEPWLAVGKTYDEWVRSQHPQQNTVVIVGSPQIQQGEGVTGMWTGTVAAGGTPGAISMPGYVPDIPAGRVESGLPGFYTPVSGGYASIYADPSEFSCRQFAEDYAQYIGNPAAREYYLERLEETTFR